MEGMLGFIEARRLIDLQCDRPGYGTLLAAQGALMPRIMQGLPPGIRMGKMGHCYANATKEAWCNEYGLRLKLLYAEGYATRKSLGIPLLHGWCVHPETLEVIDPTWNDGGEYYGWVYNKEFFIAHMLKARRSCIIDPSNKKGYDLIHKMITGSLDPEVWRHPVTNRLKALAAEPLLAA